MKKLPIICIMSLCIMLLFAAAGYCAPQKQVYLKDGSIIECRSFGRSNGKITVVVNRDVVLEFNSNEVDLKRTFASPVHREKQKQKQKQKRAAAGSPGAVPDRIPANPSPAVKTAAPRQGKISSSAKTASAAPKQAGSGVAAVSPPPKPVAPAAVPSPPVRPALKFISPSAAPAAIPTAAILAGMLGAGTLLPLLLLLLLLMLASLWKVFVKAGEAGWKGLIPIYNIFLLIQIAGKPWWWFLLLFIPGVNLIIWVLINIALAERFGKGALFGLGLFFFGIIFFPALAFGKAEYN
jgi:Family of unknown function (DUF5684)